MGDIVVAIDGTTEDHSRNVRFDPWDFHYSFVFMCYRHCFAAVSDKMHVPGPDMFGTGTSTAIGEALDFIVARRAAPGGSNKRIIVFGYSRGAYAAMRVAQAVQLRGGNVDFLGLIDVVKCTDDNTEAAISRIIQKFTHDKTGSDVFRDEMAKRHIDLTKNPQAAMGYGSLSASAMSYQTNREIAISQQVNRSSMPNAVSFGGGSFAVPAGVKAGFHARRSPSVNSRTYPMGHYPLIEMPATFKERRDFFCTHSAMGGMPFRGDLPSRAVTRRSEWDGARTVAKFIADNSQGVLGKLVHPVLTSATPLPSWYENSNIRGQYRAYMESFGDTDGAGWDKPFEDSCLAGRRAWDKENRQMVERERYAPKY